ncbi:MAG: EamA family transporter [Actinobacteria bacterium]|nr:EamA family transporter [Actinomycetota bacterium]
MVTAGFLLVAFTGPLVRLATAPESVLIVIRMVSAALIFTPLLLRAGSVGRLVQPRIFPLILLFGALSAGGMLLFFIALRGTSVAIAMFLFFTSPVYVAVLAPRTLGEPTSKCAYGALGIALAGMATIVLPGLLSETLTVTAWGLIAAILAGLMLGFYTLLLRRLTRSVGSIALTWVELTLDAAFVLPLAVVQLALGAGLPTGRDWAIALALGVGVTALAYFLLIEGAGRIPVQHWAILSYLSPVAGPLYALFILGERPSAWTLLGGALIVAAGVMVAVFDTRRRAAGLVPSAVAPGLSPPAGADPGKHNGGDDRS